LRRFVFALSVVFLGFTGVAAAQTSPTPAPARTPMVLERYAIFDGATSGTTYNELSPGNSTTAINLRAGMEFPILGHTWMATIDYGTWRYPHTANANLPAGITANCPAGDPGCVTPIGFATFNAAGGPPVMLFVPGFRPQDTETHIGLSSKISKDQRYYLGAGYIFRNENYLGYPSGRSFGVGMDKLPDFDAPLSFYGSFWQYADVQGNFGGQTSPLLGANSGRPFNVEYKMFTYRLGVALSFRNSPVFIDANVAGNRLDIRNNAPSDITHSGLFVGVGAHL